MSSKNQKRLSSVAVTEIRVDLLSFFRTFGQYNYIFLTPYGAFSRNRRDEIPPISLLKISCLPLHFSVCLTRKKYVKMMEHQHSLEASGGNNIFFVERHSSFSLSDLPPVCIASVQDSIIFIAELSPLQTVLF